MRRRAFLRGLGAAGGLALTSPFARPAVAARIATLERLREARIAITAGASPFDPAGKPIAPLVLDHGQQARRDLKTGALVLRAAPVAGTPDAVDLLATFQAKAGARLGL